MIRIAQVSDKGRPNFSKLTCYVYMWLASHV